MSKPKIMDFERDWAYIKENELGFVLQSDFNAGTDVRYSAVNADKKEQQAKTQGAKADPREAILKGLVQSAAYN